MSDITRIHAGEKLSRVVVHNGLVYLCGQVARSYDGDIKEQTASVLERIDEHLAEAGSDRSKMLSVTVYVKEMTDAPALNEVWAEWLGDAPRPARTCVQAELARPNTLVEMTVTAAL